jgi:uncharacterized protein YndB with AHSA1/START domain
MTTIPHTAVTTQVYRVHIRASAQQIWDAITRPEWTQRYGYGAPGEYDLRPGGRFVAYTSEAMRESGRARGYEVPEVAVDGEVLEVDPPRRLVQTWRMAMDPACAAEGFTRLTFEIEEGAAGVSRLTVTHELENAPTLAVLVRGGREAEGAGGGWSWVLSDLKTLLETGSRMQEFPVR